LDYHQLRHLFLYLAIVFFSCHSGQKTEIKKKEILSNNKSYQLDLSKTQVIWNGYKTTDKMKVVGMFTEFTCDRADQEFSSLDDLITDLTFSVKTSSSISGDQIRDLNLKHYFFKKLTNNFEIQGSLLEVVGDSIDVKFQIFSESKIIRLGYRKIDIKSSSPEIYPDCLVELKGSIDLKKQFNAIKAYNSIAKKCYDLHKGSDGVSKTWTQVDVHVKAFIDTKTLK
jgi:hypothetical protein